MVETQLQTSEIITQSRSQHVQSLYNQYAAKLLGHIFEVVKNMNIAEQYLIAVFKDVPHELDELSKSGVNPFCYLQAMARKKLVIFFDSVNDCAVADQKPAVSNPNNKYISLMTTEQQLVFCGVYWHGKTISKLAAELEKTEDAVKRVLKECFTTIRNSNR
jgi:DNA-directed RNA polymerase specialized sigma24 family protein